MPLHDDTRKKIEEEVRNAHRAALRYKCDYERFGYTFKLRNEIYRVIDVMNGTDYYRMGSIKEDFDRLVEQARYGNLSRGAFLEKVGELVEKYVTQYRNENETGSSKSIKK